ncbi:MAG TPA: hypothetical protein VF589_03365 [Allosphingosinicella sp.]|jgi:hypothetical protein
MTGIALAASLAAAVQMAPLTLEQQSIDRVKPRLEAAVRLIDAAGRADQAGFAALVLDGATIFSEAESRLAPLTMAALAPLAGRCKPAPSFRLGFDDEVTVHWTCPGEPVRKLQTVFKFRAGRVAWASTEPSITYVLPPPPR